MGWCRGGGVESCVVGVGDGEKTSQGAREEKNLA